MNDPIVFEIFSKRFLILPSSISMKAPDLSVPNETVRITFGRVRPRTAILGTPLDRTIEIKTLSWTDLCWTKVHKDCGGMTTGLGKGAC